MSSPPPEIQKELDRVIREMDKQDVDSTAKVVRLRERIEKKRGQSYIIQLKLDHTDPETGDYGAVVFRLWNVDEINRVLSYPLYQRQIKALIDGQQLTSEEQQQVFEFSCRTFSWVLLKESSMTEQELVQMGDWRFVRAMWDIIAQRSGLTGSLMRDVDEFFRKQ